MALCKLIEKHQVVVKKENGDLVHVKRTEIRSCKLGFLPLLIFFLVLVIIMLMDYLFSH